MNVVSKHYFSKFVLLNPMLAATFSRQWYGASAVEIYGIKHIKSNFINVYVSK